MSDTAAPLVALAEAAPADAGAAGVARMGRGGLAHGQRGIVSQLWKVFELEQLPACVIRLDGPVKMLNTGVRDVVVFPAGGEQQRTIPEGRGMANRVKALKEFRTSRSEKVVNDILGDVSPAQVVQAQFLIAAGSDDGGARIEAFVHPHRFRHDRAAEGGAGNAQAGWR